MSMHKREDHPELVNTIRQQSLCPDSPSIVADGIRVGWDAATAHTMTKSEARKVLGLRTGTRPVMVADMTREQLIDKIADLRSIHTDRVTELNGSIDALHKRLKDHRKAKRLANKRADAAEKAMRDMLDTFKEGGVL